MAGKRGTRQTLGKFLQEKLTLETMDNTAKSTLLYN